MIDPTALFIAGFLAPPTPRRHPRAQGSVSLRHFVTLLTTMIILTMAMIEWLVDHIPGVAPRQDIIAYIIATCAFFNFVINMRE